MQRFQFHFTACKENLVAWTHGHAGGASARAPRAAHITMRPRTAEVAISHPKTLKLRKSAWATNYKMSFKTQIQGTSLVAQWLRICLPMQGTRVWALVREDPTCRGTTKPVCHRYWACALGPTSHNYWAHAQLLRPTCLEPVLSNKRSHCNEKPGYRNKG